MLQLMTQGPSHALTATAARRGGLGLVVGLALLISLVTAARTAEAGAFDLNDATWEG